MGMLLVPFTFSLLPVYMPPPEKVKGDGVGILFEPIINLFRGGARLLMALVVVGAFFAAAISIWVSGWMLKAKSPFAAISAQVVSILLMVSVYAVYRKSIAFTSFTPLPLVLPLLLITWMISTLMRGDDLRVRRVMVEEAEQSSNVADSEAGADGHSANAN